MITETLEIYKCEYCRRAYQLKRFCEKHEAMCNKNPNNHRACHNCRFLTKERTYTFNNWCSEDMPVDLLYCTKKDCFIHPPKVALKGNAFETDKPNLEMPKQCEFLNKFNEPDWF